jgi:long-chain acyl-CoA synthetase
MPALEDFKPAFETLVDVYLHSVKKFGTRELFGEKKNGQWEWMTYGRFGQLVEDFRGGLAQLGIRSGDRVAVISNNRSEWAVAAYAVYTLGASYVPMYEAQHEKEWEYILNDCGAKVVLVPSETFTTRINKFKDKLEKLEHVIRFAGPESDSDTYANLLRRGAETPSPLVKPEPKDLAGLIYTSGTTGNPKGVMLSHKNLAYNVSAIHARFPMAEDDRSLSFLPWAHSFGQTVELHVLFSMGASMGIAESVEKIVDNLGEVRPTLLFAVPRIFNRIYDGLHKRMESEKPIKRKLFYKGIEVAARRKVLSEQGRSSFILDLEHKFFDRVVFEKVRARFGGRLKYAFSGAAAISKDVAEFIDNLGITVYEGYGLTETSPIFTANFPGARKIGSVGKAIPGTRVEIDKATNPSDDPNQGEIIAHGHNVMMGYFNLEEENKKVFTADGGFRTGDLGYLDADGFLYITGRVKEQYKLENGKYVVPVPIELSIQRSPFVTNVMVHGQNKPFNVAVIVPDQEVLKTWAKDRGLSVDPIHELFKRPEVQQLYSEEIAKHTREIKGYERPQKFVLISEDFTTSNDMLTPSLKLKRRNVVARYNEAIETLYREAANSSNASAA